MKNKGRLSGVLDNVPVYIVESTDLGLRGAHYAAYQKLLERREEEAKEDRRKKQEEAIVSGPVVNVPVKEKWGWVEDAVYAVGVVCVALFSVVGVSAIYQGYTRAK